MTITRLRRPKAELSQLLKARGPRLICPGLQDDQDKESRKEQRGIEPIQSEHWSRKAVDL